MSDGELFVGLMSGTSLDGVDGVLCRIGADGCWQTLIAHMHQPFAPAWREQLMALQASGPDELHRGALAANAVARAYAEVVARVQKKKKKIVTAFR